MKGGSPQIPRVATRHKSARCTDMTVAIKGTIKFVDYDRGFGFIKYEHGEIFFPLRQVVIGYSPTDGDRVTFAISRDPKNGKPMAERLPAANDRPRSKFWNALGLKQPLAVAPLPLRRDSGRVGMSILDQAPAQRYATIARRGFLTNRAAHYLLESAKWTPAHRRPVAQTAGKSCGSGAQLTISIAFAKQLVDECKDCGQPLVKPPRAA